MHEDHQTEQAELAKAFREELQVTSECLGCPVAKPSRYQRGTEATGRHCEPERGIASVAGARVAIST